MYLKWWKRLIFWGFLDFAPFLIHATLQQTVYLVVTKTNIELRTTTKVSILDYALPEIWMEPYILLFRRKVALIIRKCFRSFDVWLSNQNKQTSVFRKKQFLEHIFPSFHHLFYGFKMNGMRRSCLGLVCLNNSRRVSKIRCIVETSVPASSFHSLAFNKITSQKGRSGIFDNHVPRFNNYGEFP